MAQFTDPLSHVRVAAPCRADWERMRGNERVRFCDECSMNVYNLSNMTKKDAEALILSAEGRLCVRYYNRADGTILTKNCPVGLRALKRRVSGLSRAVVSSVLSFFAGMAVLAGLETARNSLDAATEAGLDLIAPVPIDEEAPPPPEQFTIMGDIALEPRATWANGRMEFTTEQRPVDENQHARSYR
ncbi:MAG TPA: hypothetical protein VK363_15470 [Pyrinomonadaceae bacterium]|nr:hypothetical protein [Pyrinomonadaceae bacterium]